MKVLALSAYKFSGKDTAADYLEYNYSARKVSFAGPLKDKVSTDFYLPREHLDDQQFKEKPLLAFPVSPQDDFSRNVVRFMFKEFRSKDGGIATHFVEEKNLGLFGGELKTLYQTPRSLAIIEGSTKRSIDSNYWVKKAIKQILIGVGEIGEDYLAVITDMRFKSEAVQLKESFGDNLITIRINRFDTSVSQDPSEIDLDNYQFDHVVENKGSLEEFYNKINELMVTLQKENPAK